jgi:putative DNA primase/helicase
MTALLAAALAYASTPARLPVFPLLRRGKKPATSHGFKDATTNPEAIKRLWRIPDHNIGVPTGVVSGFWVLDIDPGGDDEIRRLEAAHGELPPTRTAITPRGGRHLWFAYTGPIPSTAGKIAPSIDVRADGAYVAVVPSITADGAYSWLTDPDTALAIAPDWLITLARKKPKQRAVAAIANHRPCDTGAYGRAALDRECAALAATPTGQRNNALNLASFKLHQLVGGGELRDEEVVFRLIEACVRNGLVAADGLHSVQATIRSGMNAGLRYPRSRKGAAW